VVGGAGEPGGATTKSTSITTTISTAIRILVAAIVTISAAETGHRNYRIAAALAEEVVEIPPGGTARSTEAALPIGIELRRTGLAERPAETRWLIARLARGSSLADKEAIWPATELAMDLAAGLAVESARAAAPVGEERTG